MADEVFNLSLHTMTMFLDSKKSDMVHLTPSLEFLLVDELRRIISSDCFGLVAPKSNCVEDVWENVPTFLTRNYTHQTVVCVHDDEVNGFLFSTICSLVHYNIIHDPNIPGFLRFLSQVFELLISF
jgi:hypothetical protein